MPPQDRWTNNKTERTTNNFSLSREEERMGERIGRREEANWEKGKVVSKVVSLESRDDMVWMKACVFVY